MALGKVVLHAKCKLAAACRFMLVGNCGQLTAFNTCCTYHAGQSTPKTATQQHFSQLPNVLQVACCSWGISTACIAWLNVASVP